MNSDSLRLVAYHDGCRFEIVEDAAAGFYVFRFEGNSQRSTHDYLQDSLEIAKRFAFDEWSVPESAWRGPQKSEVTREADS